MAIVHGGSKHVHVLYLFPLISGKMYVYKTDSGEVALIHSGSKCVHVLYLFPLIQGKMYDSKTGSDNVAMVHCGSKYVHVLCIFPLITGKMYDSKTGSDYCTYSGTMPDSACRYKVDSSSESGYGSLMYKQFLNQVR